MAPTAFAKNLELQVPDDQIFLRAFIASLFKFVIPYFLASFVAFGLLRYLSFKLKLDNENAHGQEFQTRAEYLKSIGLELDNTSEGPRQSGGRRTRSKPAGGNRNTFDTIELEETI